MESWLFDYADAKHALQQELENGESVQRRLHETMESRAHYVECGKGCLFEA